MPKVIVVRPNITEQEKQERLRNLVAGLRRTSRKLLHKRRYPLLEPVGTD